MTSPITQSGSISSEIRSRENSSRENGVDVVVVGAGIAGLVAARKLHADGYTVEVLEARERVGGRLLSHRRAAGDAEAALDLGATWFWPGEDRIAALITELGIRTHAHFLEGDAIYHDPDGSSRIEGNPMDVPSGRFTDGAQSLTTAIANDLPAETLLLASPVSALRFADGSATERTVTVEHATGTTKCSHVIVALPPALFTSTVDVSPGLSDRVRGVAEITPVWMGAIAKVIAIFDSPFWRESGLAGSAISHFGPMREIHDMSGPDGSPAVLFGFVSLTETSNAPSEAEVRNQFAELFGPAAPAPIEVVIADWRAETYTSPVGVERLGAYQAFGHDLYQQPDLDGRLHWASTETSPVNPGHIEGALVAAERAVAAIVQSLPKPTLQGTNS